MLVSGDRDDTENSNASEEKSNNSSVDSGSDTDEGTRESVGIDTEETKIDESTEKDQESIEAASLDNETREKLSLKAKPSESEKVVIHPVLIEEWTNWMHKGLYEGDEEEEKKREEEELKAREEVMKKFPRKGTLCAEAPKLNQEILAHMSGSAKGRDKHFAASQNALGSAMVAVAESISLILDLEESEVSSMLLQKLGNAGKLMAGLHYQQSVARRAFIIPGVDDKYKELLKKSEITSDLFGNDLFKRLKHTKSLGKVVEELTSQHQSKKPLKTSNRGNRKSLPSKSWSQSNRQAQKTGGFQRGSLRFKDRQKNSYWNDKKSRKSTYYKH